jgi:hypothetical protein
VDTAIPRDIITRPRIITKIWRTVFFFMVCKIYPRFVFPVV